MPADELLLMGSFDFGMPDSSHCDFATDQDLKAELRTMLPSDDELSQ